MKSIVLIEPDSMLADLYAKGLNQHFDVAIASDAQSAIDVMDAKKPALLIMDVMLGRNNGIEVLHEIKSYGDWMDIPIIILTNVDLDGFPIAADKWAKYGIVKVFNKLAAKPADIARFAVGVIG